MKIHKFTIEEKEFMEKFTPGHSYTQIQEAFINKFGWQITIEQIKNYISRYKLNTGRTGQFEKGSVPHNKGVKGCAAGCEKTWFRKGHIPVNHKPVGSERITRDGYIEIKTAEPATWKLKHRKIWEEVNGPIPKGYIVIFKDGNKLNTDIENLLMIKRGVNAVLNRTGMYNYSDEHKETAVLLAELKIITSKKIKKEKAADGGTGNGYINAYE